MQLNLLMTEDYVGNQSHRHIERMSETERKETSDVVVFQNRAKGESICVEV